MASIFDISYAKNIIDALPARPEESNKGTFGRVLCICGSVGMAGAAYLSALAAYRTGAGLVEVLTPHENRTIIQTLIPEAIVTIYDTDAFDRDKLTASIDKCDALLIGCGLGTSHTALAILKAALRYTNLPTVIDADALNLLSEHKFLLKYASGAVITPHLKEMSRLTDLSVEDIQKATEKTAIEFSEKHSLCCVLKDHRTVVSDKGERTYLNTAGNSGMATGGSGDVLAGIIASLLAQNHLALSLFDAATLGVYLHASAGDRASEALGKSAVMARDIANNIRFQ